jgi:hypothetical protein
MALVETAHTTAADAPLQQLVGPAVKSSSSSSSSSGYSTGYSTRKHQQVEQQSRETERSFSTP